MCHTCSAYNKGEICEHAGELLKYLDGMNEFYQKHIPTAVEGYVNFEAVLKEYSMGSCAGCRSEEHNECSIAGCFILECAREHQVDFCGVCREFPCTKTEKLFEREVYGQWLAGNQQIKENGIESFWESNCGTPHYKAYKENE